MSILPKLALAAALVVGTAGFALADRPGPDWISMDQAIQKLKATGYSEIFQLEADDGRWEGEGLKDGKRLEFDLDPKSGAILNERPDDDD